MSQHYELLTSIIACSKLEQAIALLRNSQLFLSTQGEISELIESDTTKNVGNTTMNAGNTTMNIVVSKYFSLQFVTIQNLNLEETRKCFSTVLQVFDDKKDASSETLQKKRSKQELDIFTIFAHEFRTPLTVIQSSVELLLDFFPEWDTEKITDFLRSIHQQTSSISTLLEMIAELYDARSNTQDVVIVTQNSFEEFFQQIESILSKQFLITLSIKSNGDDNTFVKIPIRALMYVMSVALQSFESTSLQSSIIITTSQSGGIIIEIQSSQKSYTDNELTLLDLLFTENIIEDVSGKWLPYLMASICSQYLNASITIQNSIDNRAIFTLYLQR